ncbi:hypothetical protein GCM10018793_14770 [Streptomyces sulfonofaciens]|uniref:Zinc finger DksA/TraR C4-type domain-containing protein n=1 Tax=Streptomyces sulfonofaciens TaxID=68272 RepID=A0A919FXJ3_9ACTN|nr:TraR/DksA family transcriptional regulator [Streptomyces sulfonofaciens]GHH74181.1 hypothetical protein GCM10018793_14770 [Streptomyces sulfonofaciens]
MVVRKTAVQRSATSGSTGGAAAAGIGGRGGAHAPRTVRRAHAAESRGPARVTLRSAARRLGEDPRTGAPADAPDEPDGTEWDGPGAARKTAKDAAGKTPQEPGTGTPADRPAGRAAAGKKAVRKPVTGKSAAEEPVAEEAAAEEPQEEPEGTKAKPPEPVRKAQKVQKAQKAQKSQKVRKVKKAAPKRKAAAEKEGAVARKAPARKTAAGKAPAAQEPASKAGARKTTAARRTAAAEKGAVDEAAGTAAEDAAEAATTTGATRVVAKKTPGTATAGKKPTPVPKARVSAAEPGELAVRPDEEPWTQDEVDEARAELSTEALRLRNEIDSSEQSLAGLMRDSGDGAGDDQADTGTKNITREHELALAANAREMLVQTERALERLDAGTYGLCEVCGRPIGKARMQAFPRATLCVEDKQKQERRY